MERRVSHKPNSERETRRGCAQEVSQTNIGSDDESDREDDDEVDDEEVDDNEDRSSGSSDETLQCNVCDRPFPSSALLAKHQIKKKHFGCSVCDTVFPSLRALEEHKEILDHWSDDDNPLTEDDNDDYRNTIVKPQREELERLL